MRDVWLFLSLEHLEAIAGLLTGQTSTLLCLREQGGDSSQNIHKIYQLSSSDMGTVRGAPKWLQ